MNVAFRSWTLASATMLSFAHASCVMAQSQAAPASAGVQADPATVVTPADPADIVVTARRRTESLQNTPVSVTAFNQDSLRTANISRTADLMYKTPGVFLSGSGGRENSVFSIRGQSKSLNGPGAAAVVSYFAEVPSPTFGSGIEIYDMSSVQVLKGPQGTLFGRNTTGGAVLYYPTAPTYELRGYVEGTYGRFNERALEGGLTIPVIDQKIALRIAGRFEKRDGWTHNIEPRPRELDDADSRAYRVSLLVEPADWLRNRTIYDDYQNRYGGDSFILSEIFDNPSLIDALGLRPAMLNALAQQRARGPRVADHDMTRPAKVRRIGITNRTEVDLSDKLHLVNIFGYRRTRLSFDSNVDGVGPLQSDGSVTGLPAQTPLVLLNSGIDSNVEQYTNEVQLKGDVAGKLNWLLGIFYLDSRPVGTVGTFNSIGTVPGFTHGGFNYNFYTEKSRAAFGNIDYSLDALLKGLRVSAGFRYTGDKVSSCTASDVNEIGTQQPRDCAPGNPALLNASKNAAKSSAPTWQAGVEWKASPAFFAYLTTRRGYRAGGINGPTLSGRLAPLQVFDPETVTDVEGGVRTDWRLGSVQVRLNASAFVGYYDKVQIVLTGVQSTAAGCMAGDPIKSRPPFSPDGDCVTANDPAGGTLLINAGKTKVAGVDFDGRFAFTRDLAFTFATTILDPKQRKLDVNAAITPYVPAGGIPFYSVAKHTIALGGQYNRKIANLAELHAGIDYYWSSKLSLPDYDAPSYGIVNARVGLSNIAGQNVDLSVFATNLFDKNYIAGGGASGFGIGYVAASYGAPRQIGVSLRVQFGA